VRKSIEEKFWSKVTKTDGCWMWGGVKTLKGYGIIRVGGRVDPKNLRAHRISWLLHNGPVPRGLMVCHHCDNPSCVRPDHLFVGTAVDNVHDSIKKGRFCRGWICKKQDFCQRGHRMVDPNIRYDRSRNGTMKRKCRACVNASYRRRYHLRRLQLTNS